MLCSAFASPSSKIIIKTESVKTARGLKEAEEYEKGGQEYTLLIRVSSCIDESPK